MALETDETLTSNQLSIHNINLHFKFGGDSNANKYSFWRVYGGIKASYNVKNNFEFNDGTSARFI